MPQTLARLTSIFVWLFTAVGVLSLLDELLRRVGATGLGLPRLLLTLLLVSLCVLAVPAVVILRPLPKRIVLQPVVFMAWASALAMPIPLWVDLKNVGLAVAALHVAVAAELLLFVRRKAGGAGWALPESMIRGPTFTWAHCLVVGGLLGVGGPLLFGAYCYVSATVAVDSLSGGYVGVDYAGLELEERTLARGDVRVRLVGMMHIGDPGSYEQLYATFPQEDCLILFEGVTDEQGLLPTFSYDRLAERLGLESQGKVSMARPGEAVGGEGVDDPRMRHADVDVSSFSEETLEVLRQMGNILDAPDLPTMVQRYVAVAATVDEAKAEALMDDILQTRNEHLLDVLKAAVGEASTVIVPWGALHLGWIEEQLVADGWEVVSADRRRHIAWFR